MSDNIAKQVRAIYMEDMRDTHLAVISRVGSGVFNKKTYNWVQLDETIFHPKGGGQPSDEGMIGGIKVAFVHKNFYDKNHLDKFEIFHCFEMDQPFNFNVGDEVELKVNAPIRLLHSRLHTAGHVLAEAVNMHFPELEGYQGNHYPNNCYVKFKMPADMMVEDSIKQRVEAEINSWIDQNLEVDVVLEPSGVRKVKVYKNWSPCGGTHVKSLKEVIRMEITEISKNKKEGVVTIKYCL